MSETGSKVNGVKSSGYYFLQREKPYILIEGSLRFSKWTKSDARASRVDPGLADGEN